ncbi:MAG: hypothetical protein ACQESE_02880 [Nanobdellota archaeon]
MVEMNEEFSEFNVDMSKEEVLYPEYVETLVENDALDPSEAGFLEGYTS